VYCFAIATGQGSWLPTLHMCRFGRILPIFKLLFSGRLPP
jgi:hypothetical protein